jgi:hypothetical protein
MIGYKKTYSVKEEMNRFLDSKIAYRGQIQNVIEQEDQKENNHFI